MLPIFADIQPTYQKKKPIKRWGNVSVIWVKPSDRVFVVKLNVLHSGKVFEGEAYVPHWETAHVWVHYEHQIKPPQYVRKELEEKTIAWLKKNEPEMLAIIDEEFGL